MSCALAQSGAAMGSLQGSVTDSQGRALAGASVRYQRVVAIVGTGRNLAPAPGEAVVRGATTTAADGTFAVASLPAGDYLLCADVPSTAYLDPCRWTQPVRVALSAGGISTQTVALALGVFLRVRVNDPAGLLPKVIDGPWTPRKLLVGVSYANGAYQGATKTGVDSAGSDYQLVIPASTPFHLWLFSRDVTLVDAAGSAVDVSGSQIPFQAAPGQDQVFTYTVSGPAAAVR
ncbi:MAG TPA: carboxypeptidase-like regulatory domain-containing protein [Bryobacteraceae bacterium]|nr:carboxypeptidase-like regulatory domain-containing protein [Bryobacteraceae bacterium]